MTSQSKGFESRIIMAMSETCCWSQEYCSCSCFEAAVGCVAGGSQAGRTCVSGRDLLRAVRVSRLRHVMKPTDFHKTWPHSRDSSILAATPVVNSDLEEWPTFLIRHLTPLKHSGNYMCHLL
jgi:hypothetical protein